MSRLPTLDALGVSKPPLIDASCAAKVAGEWLDAFASHVKTCDIDGIMELFQRDAFWRDLLALTWDFRTFDGEQLIKAFLTDRLPATGMRNVALGDFVQFQQPFPDMVWIAFTFKFETDVGVGSGVVRLVPTSSGAWKAHTMFTNLEELKGHPEQVGLHRSREVVSGRQWLERRKREVDFDDGDNPAVLIIGAGHCGLELAARLKYLGVSTLIVEKNSNIGDTWRERYDALCLHWPVWFDHMPYLPFPSTWPVYTPSHKMAEWLEFYAKTLELNVWTSATVESAFQDSRQKWNVLVRCGNGHERQLEVNHLVFATGIGDACAAIPSIPGMEAFKGPLLKSSEYRTADDHSGKRVVVIGAGNSGHDIAADLARGGTDVTLYQRSPTFVMNLDKQWKYVGGALYSENSPPVDLADRLAASIPHGLQEGGLSQRATKAIVAGDKDLIDKLNAAGYMTDLGIKDTGLLLLMKTKGGGHYFEVGAGQLIFDGRIKLKNGCMITRLSERSIHFDDESELAADTIVFATGVGDVRNFIRTICGDAVADACKPVGGLDADGEVSGSWRPLGVPGLWYLLGSLCPSRFHSKHVALQIKAREEGLLDCVYSK